MEGTITFPFLLLMLANLIDALVVRQGELLVWPAGAWRWVAITWLFGSILHAVLALAAGVPGIGWSHMIGFTAWNLYSICRRHGRQPLEAAPSLAGHQESAADGASLHS